MVVVFMVDPGFYGVVEERFLELVVELGITKEGGVHLSLLLWDLLLIYIFNTCCQQLAKSGILLISLTTLCNLFCML
jgi:hypothetical protein